MLAHRRSETGRPRAAGPTLGIEALHGRSVRPEAAQPPPPLLGAPAVGMKGAAVPCPGAMAQRGAAWVVAAYVGGTPYGVGRRTERLRERMAGLGMGRNLRHLVGAAGVGAVAMEAEPAGGWYRAQVAAAVPPRRPRRRHRSARWRYGAAAARDWAASLALGRSSPRHSPTISRYLLH